MYIKSFVAFFISFFLNILLTSVSKKFLFDLHKCKTVIKSFMPAGHQKKKDVPGMGGIASLISIIASLLFFCNKITILYSLLTTIPFATTGLYDDISKISAKKNGISSGTKLSLQLLFSSVFIFFLIYNDTIDTNLFFPGFTLNLSVLYLPFSVLMIAFMSNAVNITDGLDGLASICIFTTAIGLAVILMIDNLESDYITVCFIIAAISLSFLYFNTHPADLFMGDILSLPLGALLAAIAIITKNEFEFAVLSGLFSIEALSSAVQILSNKLKLKKPFLMAPMHHHFELSGMPETKITIRFWITGVLLTTLAIYIKLYFRA